MLLQSISLIALYVSNRATAAVLPLVNDLAFNNLEPRLSPLPTVQLPCINSDQDLMALSPEIGANTSANYEDGTEEVAIPATFRENVLKGIGKMETSYPRDDWYLFKILAGPTDDFKNPETDWDQIILYFNVELQHSRRKITIEITKKKRGLWRDVQTSTMSAVGWKRFDFQGVIRSPTDIIRSIRPYGYTDEFLFMQIASYESDWPRGRNDTTHLIGGFLKPSTSVAVTDRDLQVIPVLNPGYGEEEGMECSED